jgi:hypothetical protein
MVNARESRSSAIANGAEARKAAHTARERVRARVEHVFDDRKNGMGAGIVRAIGIVRARGKSASGCRHNLG